MCCPPEIYRGDSGGLTTVTVQFIFEDLGQNSPEDYTQPYTPARTLGQVFSGTLRRRRDNYATRPGRTGKTQTRACRRRLLKSELAPK